jgi:Fructose-bisphosphate aldolase class-I.
LQAAPLKIWSGNKSNVLDAQNEFEKRGISASKARQGKY